MAKERRELPDVPDAPWIRDAENNGMPAYKPYFCPVCGAEDPDWFYLYRGDTTILGCSNCIDSVEPFDPEEC